MLKRAEDYLLTANRVTQDLLPEPGGGALRLLRGEQPRDRVNPRWS